MNKFNIIYFLLIILPVLSYSQKTTLNLFAGINYNSIFSTTYPAYNNVIVKNQIYSPLGIHAGFRVQKVNNKRLGWTNEIYYSREIFYIQFFSHGLFERRWIAFKSDFVLDQIALNLMPNFSIGNGLSIEAGTNLTYSFGLWDQGEYGKTLYEKYFLYTGGFHIGFLAGLSTKLGNRTALLLRYHFDRGIVLIDSFGPDYSKKHLSHLQTLQISFAYNILKNNKT